MNSADPPPEMDYDSRKQRWEKSWSTPGFSPAFRALEIPQEIQDAVVGKWFPDGVSVLDIGCGTGEIARWLAKNGYDVLGVDYSESAVKRAAFRNRDIQDNLRFQTVDVCGDVSELGTFEVGVDRGCLHGIPDTHFDVYARNVARLLKPQAHFLLLYAVHKDHQQKQHGRSELVTREENAKQSILSSLRPWFELDRAESTSIERRGVENVDPAPAIALWMIRNQVDP